MCYSSVPLSLSVILETSAVISAGVCVKSRQVVVVAAVVVVVVLYLENKLLPQRETND